MWSIYCVAAYLIQLFAFSASMQALMRLIKTTTIITILSPYIYSIPWDN